MSLTIQAIVWIDMVGYRWPTWQRAIDDFIQTYLMGRLPGGWWKWLGRATLYRAEHLTTNSVLWVNVIELVLLIFTGTVIVVVLNISWPFLQALVVMLCLFLIWKTLSLFAVRKSEFCHWNSLWRVILWCVGYTAAWLLGAIILFLLAAPFGAKSFSMIDAIRFGTISGIVGLLLQFIPISTLFRDLTLFALLNRFMDISQIVVVIFTIRLLYGIGDLVSAWVVALTLFVVRRTSEQKLRSPQL